MVFCSTLALAVSVVVATAIESRAWPGSLNADDIDLIALGRHHLDNYMNDYSSYYYYNNQGYDYYSGGGNDYNDNLYALAAHRRRATPGEDDNAPPPLYGGDYDEGDEEPIGNCTLVPLNGSNAGHPDCPCVRNLCINDYVDDKGCLRPASQYKLFNNKSPCLDSNFGQNGCGAHDENTAPYCGNEGAEDDPDLMHNGGHIPAYCTQRYCWVDPLNCFTGVSNQPVQGLEFGPPPPPVGAQHSSFWPGSGLWYSYDTCGSENSYEGSIAMEDMETGTSSY